MRASQGRREGKPVSEGAKTVAETVAAENSKEQQQRPKGKPRGRPWPKGVSGNPGGRPREVGHVRELARQHTEEAIQALVAVMRDPDQPGRARVAAAEALLDRGWGRPPQATEVSGPGGGPIIVAGTLLQGLTPEEIRQLAEEPLE